jgi:hypothetical protein
MVAGCMPAEASQVRATAEPSDCQPCSPDLTISDIQKSDYKASHGEHVLVNFSGVVGDVVVEAPPSSLLTKWQRLRVSEVSADGGIGNGSGLYIRAVGSSSVDGWGVFGAMAPGSYIVANDGYGKSRIHASIELLDLGDGWIVVSESFKP